MSKENLQIGDTFVNGNYKFRVTGFDSEGRIISVRTAILEIDDKPSKLPEKVVEKAEPIENEADEKEPEIEEKKAPVRKATTTRKTTTKKTTARKKTAAKK